MTHNTKTPAPSTVPDPFFPGVAGAALYPVRHLIQDALDRGDLKTAQAIARQAGKDMLDKISQEGQSND